MVVFHQASFKQSVHGALSAIVWWLHQLGIQPARPNYWVFAAGEVGQVGKSTCGDIDVLQRVHQEVLKFFWSKARLHDDSSHDLIHGKPGMTGYLKAKKYVLKAGCHKMVAALQRVLSGGTTACPGHLCQRCNKGLQDTWQHRVYECSHNYSWKSIPEEEQTFEQKWANKTLWLPAMRKKGIIAPHFKSELMWSRGLIPANQSPLLVTVDPDEELSHFEWGDFTPTVKPNTLATDGSLKRLHLACKEACRAGSSAVLLTWQNNEDDSVFRCAVAVSAVPSGQTVPRSELWAGTMVASWPKQSVQEWLSGSMYVVKGCAAMKDQLGP